MTEAPDRPAPAKRAGRTLPFRALAIALLILAAGMAATVALRAPAGNDSRFTVGDGRERKVERPADPLATELARCRTAAPDTVDERCRAAWEVNRRRFFGESRSSILPKADAPAAGPAREER